MPPRSRRSHVSGQETAFGRAHPNLQRILVLSCEAGPFLMMATIATGARVWKRPMWQRVLLWSAALWSFLSRWVLVGCAVTWSWNEWGQDDTIADAAAEGREDGEGDEGLDGGNGTGQDRLIARERRRQERMRRQLERQVAGLGTPEQQAERDVQRENNGGED